MSAPGHISFSRPPRVHIGRLGADAYTFAGAIDRIAELVRARRGGYVVTPNVDHLCIAEDDPAFVAAYREADLWLADGAPLLWLARAMGCPLPEKVSGSDLIRPLMARAAAEGFRVFFVGGSETTAARARAILEKENPGLAIVGHVSPPFGEPLEGEVHERVVRAVNDARPDLVLVALGCPKQELWMRVARDAVAPAVMLGVGASLDFIAGVQKRAPAWMSGVGLEWAYRLAREPRRMWQRYLVRDVAFVAIAWRALREPRGLV